MARWRAFVDVLDEVLTERVVPAFATSRVAAATSFRSAPPLYTFAPHLTPNRFWSAPGPYRPGVVTEPGDEAAMPHVAAEPSETPRAAERATRPQNRVDTEPRVRRLLKPSEEIALRTLVSLGASLDGSFTRGELRSAFRMLAQRYHPDRHPHATDVERMRLGATFAELTAAYGVLHDSVHSARQPG